MNYFDLKVGFTCNNNCIHCVISDKKSTKDLTTDEIKNIISSLPEKVIVGFTGGEASIRKDFIELLKYSKSLGHGTALQTNGAKFSDEEFTREAAKYLDSALIAIHSCYEDVHNTIVGSTNVNMYKQTIQGFKNLVENKVSLQTQTVISKLNAYHLLETYDFIQKIAPGVGMNMTYPHPNGSAWHNREFVVTKYSDIKPAIHDALEKWSHLISIEAIPKCILYPYQDKIQFNCDDQIIINLLTKNKRKGLDPANTKSNLFDEKGYADDYNVNDLSEKRKGPKCEECVFNKTCVGVWKEYMELYRNELDLFPIERKK